MDVVYENALIVANLDGEIAELKWEKPNNNPKQPIADATIEWLNTKSEYKIFTIFQGPGISTWGTLSNLFTPMIRLLVHGIIGQFNSIRW